jgi:hypothetical protein
LIITALGTLKTNQWERKGEGRRREQKGEEMRGGEGSRMTLLEINLREWNKFDEVL